MPALKQSFATALVLAGTALVSACGGSDGDKVKRGEYLVALAACSDCHTPGALMGQPQMDKQFAGSNVGFQIPGLGTYYAPNLTPDKDTGLGNWSEADIVKAMRTGERPDGRKLIPVMPYGWYAQMTDDDAFAIAAYLKSLAPIANKSPGPFGPSETPTAPYQVVIVPGSPPAPPVPPADGTTPSADSATPAPATPAPATPQ
jgi:mono/diheme cytochrome c family protein